MDFKSILFKNRLIRHVLFWIGYVLINAFAWGFGDNNNFSNQLFNELALLPVKLAVVYFNLYYLVPHFLLCKKKWQYFGLLFCAYAAGTVLMRWTYLNFILSSLDTITQPEAFFKPYRIFKYFLFDINFAVIITTAIKLFSHWRLQEQNAQELTKQNHLAQIKLLKSQVNPHFLFNTLNNLYSLSLHKSDKAPEMMLRLSDMMRYMISEGEQERVLLHDEINYLKDYLAIQTIRYGDELNVSFDVEGDPADLVIAPLLLIPFFENIFKHCIEKNSEKAVASVLIRIEEEKLSCIFKNNKPAIHLESCQLSYGVGINNSINRLKLLYPDKHEISIEDVPDFYKVGLKLTLTHKYVHEYDKMPGSGR